MDHTSSYMWAYSSPLIALFGIVVALKRKSSALFGFIEVKRKSSLSRYHLGIYIILAFVVLMGQTLGAMATFYPS